MRWLFLVVFLIPNTVFAADKAFLDESIAITKERYSRCHFLLVWYTEQETLEDYLRIDFPYDTRGMSILSYHIVNDAPIDKRFTFKNLRETAILLRKKMAVENQKFIDSFQKVGVEVTESDAEYIVDQLANFYISGNDRLRAIFSGLEGFLFPDLDAPDWRDEILQCVNHYKIWD